MFDALNTGEFCIVDWILLGATPSKPRVDVIGKSPLGCETASRVKQQHLVVH